MTWASEGWDPSPMMPAMKLVWHLASAIKERISWVGFIASGEEETIYPIDESEFYMLPFAEAVNRRVLDEIRPSAYWLNTTPYYMPGLWKLACAQNPATDASWCTATEADYYAKMNALAGFDISQDITPMTPATPEFFTGLKRVIDELHRTMEFALWEYHMRDALYYYYDPDWGGDGQWHSEYGEWEQGWGFVWDYGERVWLGRYTNPGSFNPGESYSGDEIWLNHGDGLFPFRNPLFDTPGVVPESIFLECSQNTFPISPLGDFVPGRFYVWPLPAGGRVNFLAGHAPPAPFEPQQEMERFEGGTGGTVVDFSGKLRYYDPPG